MYEKVIMYPQLSFPLIASDLQQLVEVTRQTTFILHNVAQGWEEWHIMPVELYARVWLCTYIYVKSFLPRDTLTLF